MERPADVGSLPAADEALANPSNIRQRPESETYSSWTVVCSSSALSLEIFRASMEEPYACPFDPRNQKPLSFERGLRNAGAIFGVEMAESM